MPHPSKRKGDKAEREAVTLLHDLFGYDVRRELGAGRKEDAGDIAGMPDLTLQICSRATDVVSVGVIAKPLQVEEQRKHRGTTFAATMLRMRNKQWRVILTMEQFAVLYREATASLPVCWACKEVIDTDPCIGEDGEEYHFEHCPQSHCVEADE